MKDRNTHRRLQYASGYVALNLLNEAAEELEKIFWDDRLETPVLEVRMEVCFSAKQWDAVIGVAQELARRHPEKEQPWINWAYALREMNRVAEAKAVLLEAEATHGTTSAVLHYNLGCYDCLLGNLSAARDRLNRACKMEPRFKTEALDDPDLNAIWEAN